MASGALAWPYTHLYFSSSRTIATAGPHIFVFDTEKGSVLRSTTHLSENDLKQVIKSCPIHCVAVDKTFTYIATVGDDKFLKIWEVVDGESPAGLKLLNSRELPKKPTSVIFTNDSQTILASDKFGDVFSYSLVYTPFTTAEIEQQKLEDAKDPYASHTNPSNGTLVLGHVSPLYAIVLSQDENYIVTADRDEHVRVSWYPQGYNVEMYCMGHRKFVSALHIPSSSPSLLISGGGDPVLKIWDWMSGQLKGEVEIAQAVEPFAAVKKVLGKPRWLEEGGDNEGEGAGVSKRKQRRGKGKGSQQVSGPINEQDFIDVDQPADKPEAPRPSVNDAQPILAIKKIESIPNNEKSTFLFSAVGATAIFCFQEPNLSDSSTSTPISHYAFSKPVLDFACFPASSSTPALVWVLLDPTWNASQDVSSTKPVAPLQLLTISESGLAEARPEVLDRYAPLLQAVNVSTPATVTTTESNLKALDLYADLTSFPKLAPKAPEIGAETFASSSNAERLSKRELGRLKRTARVEEVKAKVGSKSVGGDETAGQPEPKRTRSEPGDIVE
ncbi:WD40 repeat-like protein [Coprinopsis marcescibilis]|uniref:WD40 repeat-like protein n=1 Tax=Coprinopsis marcescibilis TaxID=230819 RepID=A0A5C3L0G4_COPMA|nr:WD40 repeat-like protein [Coprinopsis marcescibilis]